MAGAINLTQHDEPRASARSEAKAERASQRASGNAKGNAKGKRRAGLKLPFLVLAMALPVGLAQSWFGHEKREIAYDLRALETEMESIRNEIDEAHIEAEGLKSPARIDKLAGELGYVMPIEAPTVVTVTNRYVVPAKPENGRNETTQLTDASGASTR